MFTVVVCVALTALFAWFILTGGVLEDEDTPRAARLRALRERKQAIYDNLKDLHFEYLAGKLDDGDYQRSRHMLESEAAGVVREIDQQIDRQIDGQIGAGG